MGALKVLGSCADCNAPPKPHTSIGTSIRRMRDVPCVDVPAFQFSVSVDDLFCIMTNMRPLHLYTITFSSRLYRARLDSQDALGCFVLRKKPSRCYFGTILDSFAETVQITKLSSPYLVVIELDGTGTPFTSEPLAPGRG